MAKEEVGKQRFHIDLVGATSMGTTMAKGFGPTKSDKGGKPKSKFASPKDKAAKKNRLGRDVSAKPGGKTPPPKNEAGGKKPEPPKKKP